LATHLHIVKAGDLYGIILLPESATGRDIEEAKNLLIDRGALEIPSGIIRNFWRFRAEIVNFKAVDMSSVTFAREAWYGCSSMSQFEVTEIPACNDFYQAWKNCSALTSFPQNAKLGTEANNVNFNAAWEGSGLISFNTLLPTASIIYKTWKDCSSLQSFSSDLSSATDARYAWQNCSSLSDFKTTDIKNCTNFTSSWQGTTSLTSFPADAKLGTDAENVNFTSAWQSSGLTSLPPLDLSKGVNFLSAFLSSDISSIDPNVLLGTAASSAVVNFANIFNNCLNLTEVPEGLDLSKGNKFQQSFRNCRSLINFPPNIFDSIGTPVSYGFNSTWLGTVALNATSVENILVSINTSGQSAPSTGPQIHVDYNTATGSLSAATNSAIDSLKAKGWSIFINSVEQ
jgi:hypothetical protein